MWTAKPDEGHRNAHMIGDCQGACIHLTCSIHVHMRELHSTCDLLRCETQDATGGPTLRADSACAPHRIHTPPSLGWSRRQHSAVRLLTSKCVGGHVYGSFTGCVLRACNSDSVGGDMHLELWAARGQPLRERQASWRLASAADKGGAHAHDRCGGAGGSGRARLAYEAACSVR